MTPEERKLIDDLLARLRQAEEQQPRDPEAEIYLNAAMGTQPAAPYFMAQTLLVQQHALGAAQQRIEQLERQLREAQQQRPAPALAAGSFLGGGAGPWGAPPQPVPRAGGFHPMPATAAPAPGAPTPGAYAAPRPGGGFLAGAMQTAAGVAGGILAADAIGSLLGHGGGLFGSAMAGPTVVEETVINNFNDAPSDQPPADLPPDDGQGYEDGDVSGGDPSPDDGFQDDGGFDGGGFDGGGGDGGW